MTNKIVDGRLKLGKQLYIFAWIFEGCAVLIGLAIALMQGYASFEEMAKYNTNSSFFTNANIFIAAMPFLMVALVEITKIPFVGAFYQAKNIFWKFIFGFTICFMAFITFESAANGFERNFHALIFGINDYKRNLSATEERISNLSEQRERLSKLSSEDIEDEFRKKYSMLSDARSIDSKAVSARKFELRATIETETLANLRDEIKEKSDRRKELQVEKAKSVSEANKYFQTLLGESEKTSSLQIRNLQATLQRKVLAFETLTSRSYKEIESAGIFSKSNVRTDWEARLKTKEAEISDLEADIRTFDRTSYQKRQRITFVNALSGIDDQYDPQIAKVVKERNQLNTELTRSIGTKEKDIQDRVNQLNVELASVEARFDKQQEEIKEQKDEALIRFSSNSSRIDAIETDLDVLNATRLDLRKEINVRVGNNQVYRMAQQWFGKEQAADIERREVTLIAGIWFGSLAVLIALTGIMLALASYVLSDQSEKVEGSQKYRLNLMLGRLIQSIRRYFLVKRRTQKLPIIKEVPREIIREVEVSRVITVEKPVEVKVREVVHVPFYTNDKTLLDLSGKGSLDISSNKNVDEENKKPSTDDKKQE